ncbi:MAG TPA: DsbA family protein [Solirubrobacteraceae bacterium]|nr:DsbA family protein [Solirubrobacteraceae bacterium]
MPGEGLTLSRHEPDEQRPAFYLDLAGAEAYLAAERILSVMPVAVEWIPVRAAALARALAPEGLRCAEEVAIWREQLERTAAARGLQALRWPPEVPFDSELALRAATFARSIGKGVAFCLAAFRQAFAAGQDLADRDHVVLAAAACEMHPRAVLAALDQRSVARALEDATALARDRGVRTVPALWTPVSSAGAPARTFHGDDALEAAAAHLDEH